MSFPKIVQETEKDELQEITVLQHTISQISGSALLPPHIASHTQSVPGDILLNFYLPLCSP